MCGSPQDGCTPKAFVDYLGNNPQSPFIFDMNITDTPYNISSGTNETINITPINTTMSTCSEGVKLPYFKAPACGCSDCTGSCPKPVPPPEVKVCKLWSFRCLDVIYALSFVICSILFLIVLLLTNKFVDTTDLSEESISKLLEF